MNSVQGTNIAKWLIATASGILIGWAGSRGYQWGDFIGQLLSSEVVIGILGSAITAVLAWMSGRVPWLVAIIDALAKKPDTPIVGVITTNTEEGRALAASLPGKETVAAGTVAAETLAKAA